MSFTMPQTFQALIADVRELSPEDAQWVARAWKVWGPRGTILEEPGIVILRGGEHGERIDGYLHELLEQERERLGLWDSDLEGLGHAFWQAVRAFTLSLTFECSETQHRQLRTPYLAGRWMSLWLGRVDPLVAEVAEAVMPAWSGFGTPTDFIAALGPLATDLAAE